MTDFDLPPFLFEDEARARKRPASLKPEPNAPIEPAFIIDLREINGCSGTFISLLAYSKNLETA